MILLVLLCVILVIAVISWIRLLLNRNKSNIRGPFPLPIFGNGFEFLGDSTKFLVSLKRLAEKYEDAFFIHLFSDRYVVFSHPKYIEPVVSSTELIIKGKSYNFIKPWLGEGLLTSSGQRWRTHRKFLTSAFHFNILQNFLPVFCKNDTVLINKLKNVADGSDIELFPIIALLALDNVTESIMGVSFNAQEDSESKYVKAIEDLSSILSNRMRNPFIESDAVFSLLPYKTRQDKALKILHEHTTKVVDARRNELKRSNIKNLSQTCSEIGIRNKNAFLDLLLLAEVDGKNLDNEHIREEVDTFMFEGHDTTTSGIVFCLYLLSKHNDVQEKIYEELTRIFGDDIHRDPTFMELSQMKYLETVLKESMRLYPPVPLIQRLFPQDTEINGLRVLANTSVILNIFQMHRHPGIYENPMEFRPDRFDAANATRNPFSFISFSAGPRNCIGQKFAMMEMKLVISSIVKHFHILPSDKEPTLAADLILRSYNGVYIKLKTRH